MNGVLKAGATANTPTTPTPTVTMPSPELVLNRVLNAPRDLVWQAWTQREHLLRWSAPRDFTLTHCEGDLRPGGAWRSCMKAPDGEDHWVGGVYREIVPVERLVFTHVWDDENGNPGPETVVTLTLADEDGKTNMTFQQTGFSSASSRDGHKEGWSESFERLEELLKDVNHSRSKDMNMTTGKNALSVTPHGAREIVMTRTFAAPRDLVWQAMSRPEHIRRWWGSCGDTMTVCDMDFRVGGQWRFVVDGPQGEHGFRGEYREIIPIERMVQTFEWEGMPGHISLETLTLEERDGHTTMTITCVFDSMEDRDGMLGSGMEQGAGESYDRLEELLTQMA